MSLYTRTGDGGTTGLIGGSRVPKSHPRIEATGCVDELNSTLGLAVQASPFPDLRDNLRWMQQQLFTIGALISTPPGPVPDHMKNVRLDEGSIPRLEEWIDQAEAETPALQHFILPGGTETACLLHQARSICRRAERTVVRLADQEPVPEIVVVFLNRISDLLFAWARCANHRDGVEDVPWKKND
jgi:cob(I)alamin adenosyltransferase